MLWGSFQRDTVLRSVRYRKHRLSCLFKIRFQDNLAGFYKQLNVEKISGVCKPFIRTI